MLEFLLPLSCPELANDMAFLTFTPHDILVRDKSLKAHGATRMYTTGTYPDLSTEPVPEPVGEARAGVDIRPCRVNRPAELGGVDLVLSDDRVGVVRGVLVDVGDSV